MRQHDHFHHDDFRDSDDHKCDTDVAHNYHVNYGVLDDPHHHDDTNFDYINYHDNEYNDTTSWKLLPTKCWFFGGCE